MDDLAAFITARLDEDEEWALAASKPYKYADGDPSTPAGGVHWQWGAGENWEPVEPDLAKDIIGGYGENVQLLTIEEWPSQHGKWQMNRPYSDHMCEVDSAAAGHIARHDPARVLREVAAERAILAEHAITDWTAYGDHMCARCHRERTDEDQLTWLTWPCPTIRHLAAIWSDHPDYRAEWAASPSAT